MPHVIPSPAHEPENRSSDGEFGPLFRMSVACYHESIAAGVFDDSQVELLEGVLVEKVPKDPIHAAVNNIVADLVRPLCPASFVVRLQDPVTTDDSEPEPDVTVVRGEQKDYLRRHPGRAETVLLVEVSTSTLVRDRGLKQRVYARAGCQLYWIVNTVDREIEVFSNPMSARPRSGYRERSVYHLGESVPVVIDGQLRGALAVDAIIPDAR